jgi:hypothetical protein
MHPTTPFTPLFDNQPMNMDAIFDVPIDDWAEADW